MTVTETTHDTGQGLDGSDETGVAAVADPIVDEAGEALVDDEVLVEEISIDGMCGVY